MIYVLGPLEVLMCFGELFLLVRNVAETPPSVVVGLICLQGSLIAFLSAIVIFIRNEFVSAQCMGVGEILI